MNSDSHLAISPKTGVSAKYDLTRRATIAGFVEVAYSAITDLVLVAEGAERSAASAGATSSVPARRATIRGNFNISLCLTGNAHVPYSIDLCVLHRSHMPMSGRWF